MDKYLILLMIASFVASAQESAEEVGYVIEVHGVWQDSRYNRPVAKLYLVRKDSKLAPKGSMTGTDSLRIRFYSTGKDLHFNCSDALTCSKPLDLSVGIAKRGEATAAQAFLAAVFRLVSAKPAILDGYARAISRSGSSELVDAVVPITPEGLDLRNAFRTDVPGQRRGEMCPVDMDGSTHCAPLPDADAIVRKPNGTLLFGKRSIAPGLYQLNLCQEVSGKLFRLPDPVLVLVAGGDYGRLHQQFSTASALARTWSDTDSSALLLLRVYLHLLAFPVGN
jgi:hypothetical protein